MTALQGIGTGVRQQLGLAGQLVQAEKAVLLLAVPPDVSAAVIKAVNEAGTLNRPGHGFIALQRVRQVLGYL